MVFSSHLFCFYFLPAALALYYASPQRLRNLSLLLVSYLFYGWANPAFVLLMLFSTAVDYVCGLVIAGAKLGSGDAIEPLPTGGERSRQQRLAVTASVVSNLSLLGFFKYFDFATSSLSAGLSWLGLPPLLADDVLRITLPLGISFYTFQSMSYTIDVYRGRSAALRNVVDFACYVSMFPQLVAGPIVRFNEIADQLRGRLHSAGKAAHGVAFFALGMSKKVLLANPCGKVADIVFAADTVTTLDAWYGAVAYAFQIYFDFSGYSDMAIGLGLMLGFRLPENFAAPYRAGSITDFWRRWHMSLSRWLRDYLYIPLGGNRKGRRRTYVNLMLVMVLGGLWHGAAWTFVVWGGLHGLWLASERWWRQRRVAETGEDDDQNPPWWRIATTFLLVVVAWVFFRAPSLSDAWRHLASMVGLGEVRPPSALLAEVIYQPYYLLTFVIAALVVWFAPRTSVWLKTLSWSKAAITLVLLTAALVMVDVQGYNPFIYFIF